MGVSKLLGYCKSKVAGLKLDLFQEAKKQDGIELLVDFRAFFFNATDYVSKFMHRNNREIPGDIHVNYLGGEYHILDQWVTNFIRCMAYHKITLIFFDDGPRGSDPGQFREKLDTWRNRYSNTVKSVNSLSRHLEYNEPLGKLHLPAPWLSQEQVLVTIQKCHEKYGSKYMICEGEADDVIAKYINDVPGAYAVLADDSDFCVMKNCRFIAGDNFNWNVTQSPVDQYPILNCRTTVFTPNAVASALKEFKGAAFQGRKLKAFVSETDFVKISTYQLVDIAILAGNDFTKPFVNIIKEQLKASILKGIESLADWYKQNVGQNGLFHFQPFLHLMERIPRLKTAAEFSRRFYNLEDVSKERQELICTENNALKEYIFQGLKKQTLPVYMLSWFEGISWGSCLLEDRLNMPSMSIEDWTIETRRLMYSTSTEREGITFYQRTCERDFDQKKLPVAALEWLPKAQLIPTFTEDERKKLFLRIMNYSFKNREFFGTYGSQKGFIMHAVYYLMNLAHVNNFDIATWEYAALLSTAFYCFNKARALPKFKWIKPTMRCVTLGHWYQFIIEIIHQLSMITLLSEAFPQPHQVYQGTYFTALYMELANKVSKPVVEPGVKQALEDLASNFDDQLKARVMQEISAL